MLGKIKNKVRKMVQKVKEFFAKPVVKAVVAVVCISAVGLFAYKLGNDRGYYKGRIDEATHIDAVKHKSFDEGEKRGIVDGYLVASMWETTDYGKELCKKLMPRNDSKTNILTSEEVESMQNRIYKSVQDILSDETQVVPVKPV